MNIRNLIVAIILAGIFALAAFWATGKVGAQFNAARRAI